MRRLVDRGIVAGLAVLAVLVGVDIVSGIQIIGAYAAAAIVASMFTDARRTVLVGVVAVGCSVLGGTWGGNLGTFQWGLRVAVSSGLVVLALASAIVRDRREERLRRMTVIAETAQHAVLRATPTAIGAVGLSARYLSASAEALIGGDLYDVAATPFGVRVVVGDVRGKGLGAVQTAATVLGAFRTAAATEQDLAALARRLDVAVRAVAGDEEFVTAVLAEIDGDRVALANCGHHPPLLVTPTGHRFLEPSTPEPPLGLEPDPQVSRHHWPSGARLLFYTDGLVEARDRSGDFYPLDERVDSLVRQDVESALDLLVRDLGAFTGDRLHDDLALVLAEHRSS